MQKSKTKIFIYFLFLLSILSLEGIDFLHNHSEKSETNCPVCILSVNLSATEETTKGGFNSNICCESFVLTDIFQYYFINLNSVLTDRAPPPVS